MNERSIKIFKAMILFFFIGTSVAGANDVTIIESTSQSITIALTPLQWDTRLQQINQTDYLQIGFKDDEIWTQPGQPRIPGKIAMIGIPLHATVSYQIVELTRGEKLKGRLIPTPDYLPKNDYQEDQTIYGSSDFFPENLVEQDKIGFVRHQRVLCLKMSPVQYSPVAGEIQLFTRIVIKIDFSGSLNSPDPLLVDKNETFYEQTILNYQQARQWRKSIQRQSLKKPGAPLDGEWYKIFIKNEGIYKVTGKLLSDAGIPINSIDPSTLRIYNNGGTELSRGIDEARPDSLIENAILVHDNQDGRFDESDHILFYGKSVNSWNYNRQRDTFSHYINHYTYENIYWLTWGDVRTGKRMMSVDLPVGNQSTLVTTFRDHVFFEEDYVNPIDSGIEWFGKSFGNAGENTYDTKNFSFNLKGASIEDSASVKINIAGTSAGEHYFQFYVNNRYLGDQTFYNYSSKYINISYGLFSKTSDNLLVDGYNQVSVKYRPYRSYSTAYLDWIEFDFVRKLAAIQDELAFYSPIQAGIYQYQLSDFSVNDILLFDITDLNDVRQMKSQPFQQGGVVFTDSVNADHAKRYLSLTAEKFLTPSSIKKDLHRSDLRSTSHQADFIIITHDDFYDQAMPLKSLRENFDNLKTEVVRISDVYDEFSWGLFDPVAIRDFIKYACENWSLAPQYVLLLGSGDYDYRNILDAVDNNFIPPFQTTETYEGYSRAWDDWYVCVDGDDNFIDLSIGRLPARNPDHAENMIKKIIDYKNNPDYGDWRNTLVFVADDVIGESIYGYEKEHTEQAETITEDYLPESFNVNKIYLVEYPPVYTASITGIRKPAAQEAIINAINKGALIINYIGHGRYDLWAHEVVLDMDTDLQRIQTGKKQAFWIAGTCYFGRFDNPAYESMTEELLILKDNGAIGVLAAARLVGSAPNAALNKLLYYKLFPNAYHQIRIGDAVSSAKNSRGNLENDQKLILFCDPTLHLANPLIKGYITSISPDTIKALSRFTVTGEIQRNGALWTEYNGHVVLKAYDSKKYRTYTVSENNYLNYYLPGNTIFRGTANVTQGKFTAQFITPKDITYGGNLGKLGFYFWNDELGDGSGFRSKLPIGGTETDHVDTEGPEIGIRFNDEELFDEGFTDENPLLKIEITDSVSGINIANDIGHSITMTLDAKKNNVTELFNYYTDNYVSGSVEQPIGPLDEGIHTIAIKAWDNSNNSTEINQEFTVVHHDELVLKDVLNYPNPFFRNTEFTFWTNQDSEMNIRIYTVAGRLIKKFDSMSAVYGFNRIFWDGLDEDGEPLANGVYLYKISLKTRHNDQTISADEIQKLMIMR